MYPFLAHCVGAHFMQLEQAPAALSCGQILTKNGGNSALLYDLGSK